jgi:hypothetical protein
MGTKGSAGMPGHICALAFMVNIKLRAIFLLSLLRANDFRYFLNNFFKFLLKAALLL